MLISVKLPCFNLKIFVSFGKSLASFKSRVSMIVQKIIFLTGQIIKKTYDKDRFFQSDWLNQSVLNYYLLAQILFPDLTIYSSRVEFEMALQRLIINQKALYRQFDIQVQPNFSLLQLKFKMEDNYQNNPKIIQKRVIKHGRITKPKKNKNCPKFIVGYCWYLYRHQIQKMSEQTQKCYIEESFNKTEEWIKEGSRDYLNLGHIMELFGYKEDGYHRFRNHVNSKLFYKFISGKAFELVMNNKKLINPLSYLICLQKLTSRLPNPDLTGKIQFK